MVDEEDNSICEGESTNIIVRASEAGYIYQLRNNAGMIGAIGTPVSGQRETTSCYLLATCQSPQLSTYWPATAGLCPDVELTDLATVNVTGNVDRTPGGHCSGRSYLFGRRKHLYSASQ